MSSQPQPKKLFTIPESKSTSTTEEDEVMGPSMEDLILSEVQNWLNIHGSKLFALEASKFLAYQERKERDRKPLRQR